MKRRRFLALSAAALGLAGSTRAPDPVRWSGFAFGAELSLTLRAPERQARAAIAAALHEIEAVDRAFSLYRADSEIVRLNARGTLAPSPLFTELVGHIDRAHDVTDGTFDPTVQTVFAEIPLGQAPDTGLVAWSLVPHSPERITLAPFQQLTFNGIAQGFATDRVRETLRANGLTDILVNMGEYAALGGPWHLGIADPAHGLVARTTLTDGAIATTSAAPHVISPHLRAPRHGTVSVEAPTATLADALSTALIFATPEEIARVKSRTGATAVHTVDGAGRVRTL